MLLSAKEDKAGGDGLRSDYPLPPLLHVPGAPRAMDFECTRLESMPCQSRVLVYNIRDFSDINRN